MIFRTVDGRKHHCLFVREDLEFEALFCWHLLTTWLQPRAPQRSIPHSFQLTSTTSRIVVLPLPCLACVKKAVIQSTAIYTIFTDAEEPCSKMEAEKLLSRTTDVIVRARFVASCSPASGDFHNALTLACAAAWFEYGQLQLQHLILCAAYK